MFFWGEVGIQHVLASDFRFQIWTNQFTPGVPGVLLKHIGWIQWGISPKNWWHLYALIEASERVVTHPSESQRLCSRNNFPKKQRTRWTRVETPMFCIYIMGHHWVATVSFGDEVRRAETQHVFFALGVGRWDDPSWKEGWKGLYKTSNYLVFQSKKWVVLWEWGCFSLAIHK